jgi:ADP-heptose:LPS heptosyltransferase
LHLGQRWFAEGSTVESTLALAGELAALGHPFAISCASECEPYAVAFASRGHRVFTGLQFFEWAALFEAARVVVTVDTGATHVASAMRRPTLVLFEHRYFRLNSQEWAPYRVPSVLVRKPETEDDAALAQMRAQIVTGVKTLL